MRNLNILYVTHDLSFNIGGGAETQILKTRKFLNKKNCNVKLFDMWTDKIEDYDILHIFNPGNFPVESAKLASLCNDIGVKICVSPIYWFSFKNSSNIMKAYTYSLKLPLLKELTSSIGTYNYIKELFERSDVIIPNTQEESNLLRSIFNIKKSKISLVPNGVELRFKKGNNNLFKEKFGLNNFILYVGGVYPRKNVLKLINAFRNTDINSNLVIIGKEVDKNYFSLCKKASDKRVIFLPPLPHDSEMLVSAYKAAKVVVLPSYFETPGLSCLEGGLAGSNIVITEVGGTKEYFGDNVWYINPNNEKSISEALFSAYMSPKSTKLSKNIENKFTWDKIAEEMLKIYHNI